MKDLVYALLEIPTYLCVRAIFLLINILPGSVSIRLLTYVCRLVVLLVPRYRDVALQNIGLAFPDKDLVWREALLAKSYTELARTVVDFARLNEINSNWVKDHVEHNLDEVLAKVQSVAPNRGILLATGHLGSFELLAHVAPLIGRPIGFVFRDFNLRLVSSWWRSVREKHGNRAILRKGAFSKVMLALEAGHDVALLFDQNVTRNHAVFVPMFGRLAATSRSVGLAALRTGAGIMVVGIRYLGNDRYRVDAIECPYQDVASNEALTLDEKVVIITERATKIFEEMILKFPEGWFWMHRRWKTTPKEGDEKFYR